MKKTNILALISLAILLSFTACVPDSGFQEPLIKVTQQGTPTFEPGTKVTYKVVVSTVNGDLSTLKVKGTGSYQPASGSGVESATPSDAWDDTANAFAKGTSEATLYYDIYIDSARKNGDQIFLKFTVTDEKFESASEDMTLTVGGQNSGTEMTGEVSGSIYNFLQGPLPSGWDMLNNVGASWSSNKGNIDIVNKTNGFGDNYNNTYGFNPSYWTYNGTYIVQTGLSYESATLEDVIDAYNSGTKLENEVLTSANQVFVARLRGGSTYAIIQTTQIGYTSNNKNDFISFKYKKGSN